MSTEQLGFPGRYILETLELENFDGNTVDLTDFFSSVSYTEDIFNPCIYGSVTIVDGIDFHQYLPICGEEKLRLVYRSTEEDEIDKTFRVYRIGNKRTVDNNREAYTIYFCSEEMVTSKRIRVSKSYKNRSIADIVSDITSNYLETEKDVIIDDTLGQHHIIIPNLSPLQAIQWCSANARSPNSDGALYSFYEDKDGLRFANIETLMEEEPINPDNPIKYNVQGVERDNQRFPETSLVSYDIERASKDLLSALDDGVFANRTVGIDILTKEYRINDYSYDEDFDTSVHLDTEKLISPSYEFFEPEQRISYRPTRSYRFDSSYFQDNHTDEQYTEPENITGHRTAQLGQLTSIAVNGQMYGITKYTCGKTVLLNIPNNTEYDPNKSEEDHKYLTGKFLIKSCKHTLTIDGYTMDIVFVKDTLNSELEYDLD